MWAWALIAVACTISCATAIAVGRRLRHVEDDRSRQQWQHMCAEIGAENLAAGRKHEAAPVSPAAPAREAIPSEAVR
jgi:hypothetical protein